ncbi:MAG TPA: TetR/AcrR family transcriptional regulator [Candidatus Binatus sp.]|nr:TetR/AcrR family transcriptional regulator [Candidatus Binatus sp.]
MRIRSSGSPFSAKTERNVHAGGIPFERSTRRKRANETKPLRSTRERILSAAGRLFAEQGFNSVSMPMIAGASEITAGAIYKHFESKADLLFEVVKRAVQSIQMPIAPTSGPDPDATLIPRLVAMYTEQNLKLLRQLSLEMHSASSKHPKVRRILRRALNLNIQQLRWSITVSQQAGRLDPALDSELLARAVIVFIMGLAHMETIAPQLVGDPIWRDFIQGRSAAMLGIFGPKSDASSANDETASGRLFPLESGIAATRGTTR